MGKVVGIVFGVAAALCLLWHVQSSSVSLHAPAVMREPPSRAVREPTPPATRDNRPPGGPQVLEDLPQRDNVSTDGQVEITEEEEAVLALFDEMADAFASRDDCDRMVDAADSAVAARESDIRHLLALAEQPRSLVPMERRQAVSAEVLERMARFDVQLKRAMSLCSRELLPVLSQLSAIKPDGVMQ